MNSHSGPDPDMPVPDIWATGTTLHLNTQTSLGDEPALSLAGARPACASTAVKVTRATAAAAAAAAVEGAGAEALETGACPGGSTGRGGKKLPSPADLSMTDQSFLLSCSHYIFLPYYCGKF